MEPTSKEIEQVGEALVSLNQFEYSSSQLDAINDFLQSYGKAYDNDEINKVFKTNAEVLEAVKVLDEFIIKFQDNEEIMEEIKIEFDDILYNLNDSATNITF